MSHQLVSNAKTSTAAYELGYRTCLDCGGKAAMIEKARKAKCSAPAYNKVLISMLAPFKQPRGVWSMKPGYLVL